MTVKKPIFMKHKLAWKLSAKHPVPNFMKIWYSLISDTRSQMGRQTWTPRNAFVSKEILKMTQKNLKFGLNFKIMLIVTVQFELQNCSVPTSLILTDAGPVPSICMWYKINFIEYVFLIKIQAHILSKVLIRMSI